MKRPRALITITAAAAALAFAFAVPAPATASEVSDPIATGFAGPLQMDLGSNGQIYVAQDFAGIVTKIRANGTTKDVVVEPGMEVAGVASNGYDVTYTVISQDPSNPSALLKRRLANGHTRTIADIYAFEAKHNPDAGNVYGFRNLSNKCAAQVPPEIGGEPYNGIVESHPYAVANAPDGGWYVADAAANDVIHVSPGGKIEVFGVPRPRKSIVTAEAAEAVGLPECTIGATYAFEPVPTDVEVKSTGALIVSLLPGGPEDASLGARGAVIRLAGDGEFANLAEGFLGATNVALAPGGKVYVCELFGGKISLLQNHTITPVVDLVDPAAIEFKNGKLYASTDVFGAGSIVKITP